MEEEKYTMAQLLAEEDARIAREQAEENQRRIEYEEKLKLERKQKQQELLEMKERKHQEYIEMKEKKRLEWLAEKERRENTFEDKTLTCKKCGKEWVWTASEQKFYKEKGFYRPSMCKDCRAKTKVINNFHKQA